MEHKLDYDDPYVMCVWALLTRHTMPEMKRMLTDDEYLANLVLKETRLTDFGGPFLDAIVETILTDKRRMEMMRELDKLSKYFYQNLDKERLRNNIRILAEYYGFFDLDE